MQPLRELKSTLEATESYLRVLACGVMSYPDVIAFERAAIRTASKLLIQASDPGGEPASPAGMVTNDLSRMSDEAGSTEEFLDMEAAVTLDEDSFVVFGDDEDVVLDTPDRLSEEDETPAVLAVDLDLGRVTEDAVTSSGEEGGAKGKGPARDGGGERLGDLVSVDLPPQPAPPEVLEYSDTGLVEEEVDKPAAAVAVDQAMAQYVTWSDDDSGETGDDAPESIDEAPDYLKLDIDEEEAGSEEDDGADDVAAFGDELFLDDDEDEEVLEFGEALDSDDEESGEFEEEQVTFIADMDELEGARAQEPTSEPERDGPASIRIGVPVTSGLYGDTSLPTIREGREARPRAAAIQIDAASGTGQVIGREEEDEPIEIGDLEDYGEVDDEEDMDSEGGFRVALQEYEEEYEDDDESEEVDVSSSPTAVAIPTEQTALPGEVADLERRAMEAAEAGDMQLGTDLYSDLIDLDPDQFRAYVGRGRLCLDLGDYTRAMSDFMVAEELMPEDPEPQIAIGDLFFARKDYRKAIAHFNAALDMAPNHAMAFCRRGISHYYRKNFPQAMEDLVRAKQLDAEIPNIDTYISMARKKASR